MAKSAIRVTRSSSQTGAKKSAVIRATNGHKSATVRIPVKSK